MTHDPREEAILGGRVAVTEQGRVDQIGTAGELRAAPASPLVEELFRGSQTARRRGATSAAPDARILLALPGVVLVPRRVETTQARRAARARTAPSIPGGEASETRLPTASPASRAMASSSALDPDDTAAVGGDAAAGPRDGHRLRGRTGFTLRQVLDCRLHSPVVAELDS